MNAPDKGHAGGQRGPSSGSYRICSAAGYDERVPQEPSVNAAPSEKSFLFRITYKWSIASKLKEGHNLYLRFGTGICNQNNTPHHDAFPRVAVQVGASQRVVCRCTSVAVVPIGELVSCDPLFRAAGYMCIGLSVS